MIQTLSDFSEMLYHTGIRTDDYALYAMVLDGGMTVVQKLALSSWRLDTTLREACFLSEKDKAPLRIKTLSDELYILDMPELLCDITVSVGDVKYACVGFGRDDKAKRVLCFVRAV